MDDGSGMKYKPSKDTIVLVSESQSKTAEESSYHIYATKFEDFDEDGFPRTVVFEKWLCENFDALPPHQATKLSEKRFALKEGI